MRLPDPKPTTEQRAQRLTATLADLVEQARRLKEKSK
jgi:hypothetical protein